MSSDDGVGAEREEVVVGESDGGREVVRWGSGPSRGTKSGSR